MFRFFVRKGANLNVESILISFWSYMTQHESYSMWSQSESHFGCIWLNLNLIQCGVNLNLILVVYDSMWILFNLESIWISFWLYMTQSESYSMWSQFESHFGCIWLNVNHSMWSQILRSSRLWIKPCWESSSNVVLVCELTLRVNRHSKGQESPLSHHYVF